MTIRHRARAFSAIMGVFVASLALLNPSAADAAGPELETQDEPEHVVIQASTDFLEMHPGDAGLLSIEVIVDEGWHTYWPGVSDTGYGLSLAVDHPVWVELGEPIWPTPERYLQKGDILDHIYAGTQTVLYPFRVSSDAKPGQVLVMNIDAGFLVCDEICLPGTATSSTTVQLVEEDQRASESSGYDELHALYEQRPRPFNPSDPAVRMQWIKHAAAVMFRDATRIEFYPDLECSELADPISETHADGNRMEITFVDSENKILSGRIRIWTRDGTQDFDINETHNESMKD